MLFCNLERIPKAEAQQQEGLRPTLQKAAGVVQRHSAPLLLSLGWRSGLGERVQQCATIISTTITHARTI